MYKILIVVALFFSTGQVLAQPGDLVILGASPEIHLLHTVAPKENWYSIGRLYNISPKEIAPVNSFTIDKPLNIGQQLKIPLTNTNFSQDGNKADDEVFVPVYHTVQDKEWMYRISTNYNKVPVETLEKWNRVDKDQAKAGMKLIVGYLKVKKDQSALAGAAATPVKTVTPPVTTPPVVKTEEKKAEEKIVTAPPKEEKEPVKTVPTPVENRPAVINTPAPRPVKTSDGEGYFKSIYENGGKKATGAAGIFKSRSGWEDGKYYALMNDMPIGAIVKITNPSTSRIVYAKVLGQLPDMKESVGLTLRLSDAAAVELGANEGKFSVVVN